MNSREYHGCVHFPLFVTTHLAPETVLLQPQGEAHPAGCSARSVRQDCKPWSAHIALLFTDTAAFLNRCSRKKKLKELRVTARPLEWTQSIKAEGVPASISTGYITGYFESAQNGGGPVADVQLFPEEKSAIITFSDHKGKAVLLHLTKVLPGRGLERKLPQIWALGAWLAVAEASVHSPAAERCSGFRNPAPCLGFQSPSGFLCCQRFMLICAWAVPTEVFSPFLEDFICHTA